ncbi:hypothetical protein TNCT_555051 [Trichonephila clavata]|uniref:Uncharacterized protein n=1 Tax=Trichonephila clavata TaxID=2740835 RepID=A0A8X6J3A1_TRICU|nr:hypothetical protein TNCT_555051 [Trichonephila clavata]
MRGKATGNPYVMHDMRDLRKEERWELKRKKNSPKRHSYSYLNPYHMIKIRRRGLPYPTRSAHYRALSSRKEEKFGDSRIQFTLEAK